MRGFKTKKEANIALSKLMVEVDELGLRQNDRVDDETLAILKKRRSKQIQRYLTLQLADCFESDEKQPVFTIYNHSKHKMDYCRLAFLNEKLESIYQKNPHLPQINVHTFRHTHASLLFAAGASIKDVQTQLGLIQILKPQWIFTLT